MSYLPGRRNRAVLADCDLVVIPSVSGGQTLVTGGKVNLSTPSALKGSWTPTIISNVITLSAGYYYYLETTQQAYYSGSAGNNAYIEHYWYDEGAATQKGTTGMVHKTNYEDTLLTSYDEIACALIDASASAVDVSVRMGNFLGFNLINSTGSQYEYAGLGRQLIWRLDP